MPELPEVETTCAGIRPHLVGNVFSDVQVRQTQLRWAVDAQLKQHLMGLKVVSVTRRAKYCLLNTAQGSVILHLGMSGHLKILPANTVAGKHDHVDFVFADQKMLRFNDQRKFGAVLWAEGNPLSHSLLKDLGVEPLTDDFTPHHLYQLAQNRTIPIKTFIMDGHNVVGVGNIYASESLFMANILPTRKAASLNPHDCERLVAAIKHVLQQAIKQGGTTLKDFLSPAGNPGYFSQSLQVYGRAGQGCYRCQTPIQQLKIGQRASYFCPVCQQ